VAWRPDTDYGRPAPVVEIGARARPSPTATSAAEPAAGPLGASSALAAVAAAVAAVVWWGVLSSASVTAPTLRATIDTGAVSLGLVAAWEARAWLRGLVRLGDLLLGIGLLTLMLTWLETEAVPAMFDLNSSLSSGLTLAGIQRFGVGAGALLIAGGALASDRLLPGRVRWDLAAAGASLVALALATLGGVGLHAAVIGPQPHPAKALGGLTGAPLAPVILVLAAAPLVYAAAITARRARGRVDTVEGMLACGLILLAGAGCFRFGGALPGSDVVTPGVVLRLLGCGMVLAAVLRRNREVRGGIARAAALAERQRVARDLHDGLAQDLAFIAAHGARITDESGAEHPVAIAARRALAISRGTISDLTDLSGMPLSDALAAVAQELGSRFGIAIDVAVPVDRVLPEEVCVDLVRIVREAIANAARHGAATTVTLSTHRVDGGTVLRIRDNGKGRPDALEGFGLRSMRDRAAALGGRFTIRDLSGGGTELEVAVP
jgi:signal transduction histidine kinase